MQRHRSRKGAPGIVEVARRANVSPATVSRFYNSPEMLKSDTRARIRQCAAELGYIRDRTAAALHNRSSGTMGLVVPTISNAIFAQLIEAFSNHLQAADLTTLVASHNYDLQQEVAIIRSLLERRIDGVAIVGHDHSSVALDMLSVRDVPVVSVWQYDASASIPSIGVDNRLAAAKVTRHLLDLGHRDIAFLFADPAGNDRARARRLGAIDCMKSAGLSVTPRRLLDCPYDIAQAKALGIDLFESDRPSAVVCGNDIIAQGILYAAMQCGLSLPDDCSIVGIGDFAGSAQIVPALTTVRLPARRIGSEAARRLINSITEEPAISPFHIELDAELIIRHSTARVARVD